MATESDQDFASVLLSQIREIVQVEIKRLDSLIAVGFNQIRDEMEAERRRVNEQMELRAQHQKEVDAAEAKRIDANRAGDVAAVGIANERAIQQASVLASQVDRSAETLRTLVGTTASAVAQQLAQVTEQLTTRLLALENARYESRGSSGGFEKMLGWMFAAVMAMAAVGTLVFSGLKK